MRLSFTTIYLALFVGRTLLAEQPQARWLKFGDILYQDRSSDGSYASERLQSCRPLMAYQLGRDIFRREWTASEGVHGLRNDQVVFGAVTSCILCHNLPFGSAGYGGNAASGQGWGRNTPHLFGAGLIESIGFQIRADIMERFDKNRNAMLDVPSETKGQHVRIEAEPGILVDFGSLEDLTQTGIPSLNQLFRVRYLNSSGKPIQGDSQASVDLKSAGVSGYDIVPAIFSSSVGDHQFATLRQFTAGVFESIFGLAVPSEVMFPGNDRECLPGFSSWWTAPSLAGTPQERFTLTARASTETCKNCVSRSELDLVELFLVNQPRPAIARQSSHTRRGEALMRQIGCTQCHVENWLLRSPNPYGAIGVRKLWGIQDEYNIASKSLEGQFRVKPLPTVPGSDRGNLNTSVLVKGIYSDFRHHDMGLRFYEYRYTKGDVVSIRRFRTPPLWGIGSSAPYGHDGRSPGLDEVIRRHGGEATVVASAYVALSQFDRTCIIEFLKTLVLHSPDEVIPDGLIAGWKDVEFGGRGDFEQCGIDLK